MTTFIDIESRPAGRWTKQEHEKFLYGLKLYGKNWKKIEDLIQTRTSTQIRSHAQKFFIKIKKQYKSDDDSQIHQNSCHSKFAQETILTHNEEKLLDQEKSVFSFYFEKIARNFILCERQGQDFNFWNSLVDVPDIMKHTSCEQLNIPREFQLDLRKMNSCQETQSPYQSSSCQLLRTNFSSFEEYKH